jgi:hypothetical protein
LGIGWEMVADCSEDVGDVVVGSATAGWPADLVA